jgi:hypothetical protein
MKTGMNILVLGVEMHQDPRPPPRHTRHRRLRRVNAIREDEEIVEPSNLRCDVERRLHLCSILGEAKENIARLWNKEVNIERLQPLKLDAGIAPEVPDAQHCVLVILRDQ